MKIVIKGAGDLATGEMCIRDRSLRAVWLGRRPIPSCPAA